MTGTFENWRSVAAWRRVVLLSLALFAVALAPLLAPAPARAETACDLIAAPNGDDSAPGTLARPLRRVNTLVDRLGVGETGCLRSGAYETIDEELWLEVSQTTLTAYGDERAEVRGHLAIGRQADGVTVEGLVLDGENELTQASPFIGGPNATFRDNEVTNDHTSICFLIAGQGGRDYVVRNALIEGNRIHDCGQLPATNHAHGIYVQRSANAVIRDNVILDNADRGIQLYYDAQDTEIYGNVIDGNGQGIIISGDRGYTSNGSRIHHNVIANSVLRFNVEEFYPEGNPIGSDNLVTANCVYTESKTHGGVSGNSGIQPNGRSFTATGNVIARPTYTDRRRGELAPGSACAAQLDGTPAADGRITLDSSRRRRAAGRRVTLTGRAPDSASVVRIQRRRHGNWKSLGRAKLRADGSFRSRERVRGRNRARFRASVPGHGHSNTVAIVVKRRR